MGTMFSADAVVLERPERLAITRLPLDEPGVDDVVVDLEWSGISTGTERLLYTGSMPEFPGMGYPLVPGYESVGRVARTSEDGSFKAGERVFVPGAACYGEVRGLFGGAASRLVVPARRVARLGERTGEEGVLLALAATAFHALTSGSDPRGPLPELIVGHGVLGRLVARLCTALGGRAPTVWEQNPARHAGAEGYAVTTPDDDDRRDYGVVCDVSGDPGILDALMPRIAPRGEIVLAGFYGPPLSFAFPPAFMKEARIRVASEWQPEDLRAVTTLVDMGRLRLDGLITHCTAARAAPEAYRTAFSDPGCLKMVLDWSAL